MFNVETIIKNADLVTLAQKAGATLHQRYGEWRGTCPLHGGDNESAFVIAERDGKQLWNCFSGDCGGGDIITFVQAWRGWDFKQACEFLGGDIQSDPVEMERLAQERHAKAKADLEDKQRRMDAARKELQVAQKHLYYHQTRGQWARDMWGLRGLDEGMQEFFYLGSCDDFSIGEYHTPTLTIPIFSEDMELLNIKHRLVNPVKPNDKYRPETSGLGAFPPLLAIPPMGYDGDLIIVVEGEIKAMVTWTRLSISDFQVIGVPGKDAYKRLAAPLAGKKVLVIPDPQDTKDALDLAHKVGWRVLFTPDKIDDYLLETNMSSDTFYQLIKQARRV